MNGLYLPEGDRDAKAEKSKPLLYRDLVKLWWKNDPFECRYYGGKLELVRIWKPGKGFIFSLFKKLFGEDLGPVGPIPIFLDTG